MKKMMFLAAFMPLLFFTVSCTSVNSKTEDSKGIRVTVEIDYGGKKPAAKTDVTWDQPRITALQALQAAAEVKTHPLGKYVFVSSINQVEGKRGDMGWYYKVNGKSCGKLAVWNELEDGDTVTWIYKKDVCSETVDKK